MSNVSDCVEPDGSLCSYLLCWVVSWDVGDNKVGLDGRYTSAELREIADHMDRINLTQPPKPA